MAAKKGFLVIVVGFSLQSVFALGKIPVYIEDSHAGSFFWLSRFSSLDEPHTLILFEAHNDASAHIFSDDIREKLRKYREQAKLDSLENAWRSSGYIQCYNWLEPLMPFPLTQVIWVPSTYYTQKTYDSLLQIAHEELSCHQQAVPGKFGNLSKIYEIATVNEFTTKIKHDKIVVSIDLDYFTEVENGLKEQVDLVVDSIVTLKNVMGITIALSSPYMHTSQQVQNILKLILERLSLATNVNFYFEPYKKIGIDKSQKALEFAKKGLDLPVFQLEKCSADLQSVFVFLKDRIYVSQSNDKWKIFLKNATSRSLKVDNSIPNQLICKNSEIKNIEWKILRPKYKEYNVIGIHGFSSGTNQFVDYVIDNVTHAGNSITPEDILPFFHSFSGTGTVHVFAEGELDGQQIRSAIYPLHKTIGSGYLKQLLKIVNLPYVYGASSAWSSLDTIFWGIDCANFVAYGRQSTGYVIPNVNTSQLRKYLDTLSVVDGFYKNIALDVNRKPIVIDSLQLYTGLILHFNTHVGALYQDNIPLGFLDKSDIILHKLEDEPDFIPLGNMKQSQRTFVLMRFKSEN